MQATTGRSCHRLIPGTAWTTIRFSPARRTLYVGAAKDVRLTIARVDAAGNLTLLHKCRNARARATVSSQVRAQFISHIRSSVNPHY